MIVLGTIFLVLAAFCFALAATKFKSNYDLTNAGFMFAVLAVLLLGGWIAF